MGIFADKIAIVTGGASGLGRALSEELARQGAVVILADLNFAGAQGVAAALVQRGLRAEAIALDVADAAAVGKLVDATVSRHARLDYMFNNAAIAVAGELRDSAPADWRRILEVNLLGVVFGTMAAYRIMARAGSGRIVNIASVTGLMPTPILTHYSTTKWGVVGFTTALRAEAAGLGVDVSVACPGLVRTNIPDRTTYLNVRKEEYLARLPWRWMMEPNAAARSILRGVARNRAIIVCPWHTWLMWRCYHYCPILVAPLFQKIVKEFRKLRVQP